MGVTVEIPGGGNQGQGGSGQHGTERRFHVIVHLLVILLGT